MLSAGRGRGGEGTQVRRRWMACSNPIFCHLPWLFGQSETRCDPCKRRSFHKTKDRKKGVSVHWHLPFGCRQRQVGAQAFLFRWKQQSKSHRGIQKFCLASCMCLVWDPNLLCLTARKSPNSVNEQRLQTHFSRRAIYASLSPQCRPDAQNYAPPTLHVSILLGKHGELSLKGPERELFDPFLVVWGRPQAKRSSSMRAHSHIEFRAIYVNQDRLRSEPQSAECTTPRLVEPGCRLQKGAFNTQYSRGSKNTTSMHALLTNRKLLVFLCEAFPQFERFFVPQVECIVKLPLQINSSFHEKTIKVCASSIFTSWSRADFVFALLHHTKRTLRNSNSTRLILSSISSVLKTLTLMRKTSFSCPGWFKR